jgi:sensor histidine kinase YesM
MKKSIVIASHIFLWITLAVFLGVFSMFFLKAVPDAPFAGHLYQMVAIGVVIAAVLFYATFFVIPWARKNKRNLIISIAALLLLILSYSYKEYQWGFFAVMRSTLPPLTILFFAYIFRKYSDSVKLEEEKQDLVIKNTRSELALLKHQINPHFFFNTLNNVDSLMHEDVQKASTALNKLSDIMRYMIYDSENEKVSLKEELAYIESYISLQKLRLADENMVSFNIKGNVENMQIPPMLFITFIENAFKHSSLQKNSTCIVIKFELSEDQIVFSCTNSIASFPTEKDETSGIGLELVKKRLELIYPKSHELKIDKKAQTFTVFLKIKTNAN